MSEGKVRVVVRSRRVPIGTLLRTEPIYSTTGVLVGSRPSRLVIYGKSLDEDHQRTIEEAQKLACNLGLGLEVVDESRLGLFSRFRSALGRNGKSPAVVVPSSHAIASAGLSHTK